MVWHKCSDGEQMVKGDPTDYATYVDPLFSARCDFAFHTTPRRMLFGAYHYFQPGIVTSPTDDTDPQMRAIRKALMINPQTMRHIDALAVDFEEYHAPGGSIETNTNISERLHLFVNRLAADHYMGAVPFLIYTNQSMTKEHSPASDVWIGQKDNPFNMWMAQWLYSSGKWSWSSIIRPGSTYKVVTPGFSVGKMVQWAANITGLDNTGGGSVDLSLWMGDEPSLYQFFNASDLLNGSSNPPVVTPPDNPPDNPPDYSPPLAWSNEDIAAVMALFTKHNWKA
jgi:hypothetical protein